MMKGQGKVVPIRLGMLFGPPEDAEANAPRVDFAALISAMEAKGWKPFVTQSNGVKYLHVDNLADLEIDVWSDGEVRLYDKPIPWDLLDLIRPFVQDKGD